MRGANNLQRQLRVLEQRHNVTLSGPHRVPLTSQPDHPTLILEGIASTSAIDIDRVSFAPFCFGPSLPASLPLLLEHQRPAGTATLSYDAQGGLRVRTSPLSGDAARYAAFSIAVRNIQFHLRHADRKDFHFTVTAAELTECSLTEYPHLDAARVLQRLRPNPQVEFYTHAQRGFENIGRQLAIIQSQMEARR
jgi:hypothetical protein